MHHDVLPYIHWADGSAHHSIVHEWGEAIASSAMGVVVNYKIDTQQSMMN
jgi:hypothetical protein